MFLYGEAFVLPSMKLCHQSNGPSLSYQTEDKRDTTMIFQVVDYFGLMTSFFRDSRLAVHFLNSLTATTTLL